MSDKIKNYFELIYIIVDYGLGSKVLKKAKKYGISGGTVVLGKGTLNDLFSNLFSLSDTRKEIVIMGTDAVTADKAIDRLNGDFKFEKPNHGIVYSIKMGDMIGTKLSSEGDLEREEEESMYQVITTIVNRGRAELVIEAAQEAGSKGGTIINARGSGIHENMKLFNMEIEPEKEMILILSKKDITDNIVENIKEKLEIEKPGNGIIFVQDVNRSLGIYE